MLLARVSHIGSRGVRRGLLFEEKRDYIKFLSILEKVCGETKVKVLAYCLMSNHYHLIMALPREIQTTFLRKLNFTYARTFNLRKGYSGHVFEARTWVFERGGPALSAHLMRYTHLNPVRPKMVLRPEDYAFSSYGATLGLRPMPAFLDPTPILEWFSSDPATARAEYRQFVESMVPDLEGVWETVRAFEVQNAGQANLKRLTPMVELLTMTAAQISKAHMEEALVPLGLTPLDLQIYAMSKFARVHKCAFAFASGHHRNTVAGHLRELDEKLTSRPELAEELDALVERGLTCRPIVQNM